MPPTMAHGRTARGAGGVRPAEAGRRTPPTQPVALGQTLPSVAPGPRFRPPQITDPRPFQAPNQSPQWRGGDGAGPFDRLITRDRHAMLQRGTRLSGVLSSMPDPPSDGPIRPTMRLINVTWNWQVGTGAAYRDDLTRAYTHVGEQGSGWTSVYGGAPGFYRLGPGGTPVGDPALGPARVFAGPPHGLHTNYPPDRRESLARYRARPQMVAPRVDRLSNSRIAGQTYSQWTQHQGGGRQ